MVKVSLNSHVLKSMLAVEDKLLFSVLQWRDFIVTQNRDGVNKVVVWL